jgi:hypothetical protein
MAGIGRRARLVWPTSAREVAVHTHTHTHTQIAHRSARRREREPAFEDAHGSASGAGTIGWTRPEGPFPSGAISVGSGIAVG